MKNTTIVSALLAAAVLALAGCAADQHASQTGNNPATASAGSTSGSGSVSAKAEQANKR